MTIKAEYTFIKSQLKKSLIVNDSRSRNEISTEFQRRLAKKIKANGKEPTDQKLNVETEDKEKQ